MSPSNPPLNDDVRPWKLLSSSIALDEKWLRVRKDTVQLPSGKIVDDYLVWESPQIVGIIPVTPEGDFVLVEQYRHAVGKILHQFPAGAVDANESLEAAAAREMEEETGYKAAKLVKLGVATSYSTKLTGSMNFYLALDATPSGHRHYDEQEETKVILKTTDELLDLVDTHDLQPMDLLAGTFLALRYLQSHDSAA